jgi:CelD/BcsL family acetyltransferase involved in cellulose biosynthesis
MERDCQNGSVGNLKLMSIHIERINTIAQLDTLRTQWNRLANEIPFRRFEWLATWWKHYRQPHWDLFVVTACEEDGELVGLLPLYLSKSLLHGRVLRFLGSGEVCSDYLTLLTAEGLQHEVTAQVANWLTDEGQPDWDSLELVGVDQGDVTINLLAELLGFRGFGVHYRAGENCWRIKLPSTWADYLASLSKSRRERVRKLQRRSFDSGRVVSGILENPEEFDFYFNRLVELHQKRRNSLGDAGCFASQEFKSFHRDVMRQMLSLGILRLLWTNLDGVPAAIEYAIKGGDTVYFYQSGIEPRLSKQNAGWLSTIGSIQASIEEGFQYFDFMRGDEAYKTSWNAVVRPAMEVRIIAPRLVPRFRHTVWRGRKILGRLKRTLKARILGSGTPSRHPPNTVPDCSSVAS